MLELKLPEFKIQKPIIIWCHENNDDFQIIEIEDYSDKIIFGDEVVSTSNTFSSDKMPQ